MSIKKYFDNKDLGNTKVAVATDVDSLIESFDNIKLKEPIKELPEKEKSLKTEDTGIIFEKAICLAYGINYDRKYKYDNEIPEKLKLRLSKLLELFPMCRHTAKNGSRYDFTSIDETRHLSAKSTKKGVGKVAPQVIGQSQPKKFCEIIGIEYSTNFTLKKYIQSEILKILPILISYTFDCDTIYYNQEKESIRYITLTGNIDWNKYEFIWTRNPSEWKNSTTLKIKIDSSEIALLEFQIHSTNRSNMAIRWYFENFLTNFKEFLNITSI